MVQLFLGLLVLCAAMMVARWFVTATPSQMVRTAKWTGAALLLGSGALMLATGRLAWAVAAAVGLLPFATRIVRLHGAWRSMREAWGGARSQPGGSRVRTRFLDMRLEHDSGTLWGEVLDGPFRGRKLAHLSLDEAMELRRQCAADPQSAQVLDAWLDRTWPDWRDRARHSGGEERQEHADPRGPAGGMTKAEAYAVLGLRAGASPADVKAAHRRLMGVVHPDHGGSDYLAARINQAKDILLAD